MLDLTHLKLISPDQQYVVKYNALVDAVAALAAPVPAQQRFTAGAGGQSVFLLDAAPMGGICILSIDGYTIHHYTVSGATVTSSVVALAGEETMITYWTDQNA